MDLVKLQKKAILIPTPGQTEQEYLAKYLMENQMFYTVKQKDFSLHNALRGVDSFAFYFPKYNMEQYKKNIQQFVLSLQSRNFAPQ
jgi:UDP-N-acetylglucosamine:LPS N-acetylglucosamine transferase